MTTKAHPQSLLCQRGEHCWTAWGNFTVAAPKYELVTRRQDVSPEQTPIEAYRWRRCECGAAEREAWDDRSRKLFEGEPSDDRS